MASWCDCSRRFSRIVGGIGMKCTCAVTAGIEQEVATHYFPHRIISLDITISPAMLVRADAVIE
jgi:hypothetical protein